MQNVTPDLNTPDIQENVLIKAVSKQQYKKAINLLAQAQSSAKKIVNTAYDNAEAIHQESYRIGYERGLLLAVDTIAQFINNKNKHVNDIYLQLRQECKTLLTQAVHAENVVLALFEHWVEGIEEKNDTVPFYVLLPLASRHYKKKLKQYVDDTHQGHIIFEYHQDSRYVFKYREQLVEFSPDMYIDDQTDALLMNKNLHSLSDTLSNEALSQLYQQIEKYFPATMSQQTENEIFSGEIPDDND